MPRLAAPPWAGTVVALTALWLTMKVLSVWAWVRMPGAWGDTWYYFQSAERAFGGAGLEGVLREYPTPAAALLLAPYALGATEIEAYRDAIVLGTSIVDAAFAVLLGRLAGPFAVCCWIAFTTLLSQLPLLRFDVLPAVVAGAVVLLLVRGRPTAAAVLTALGTGLKVWPILLAPLSLADARARLRSLVAFAGTGLALVAACLPFGGWDRLFSPLDYQRDRGLQIEAVPATIPMLRWAGGDASLSVSYGPYYAYEVAGPAAETWIALSDAAAIVAFLVCAALLVSWFVAGGPVGAVPYLALAFVTAFVVTSRALSPQYLLWLAAPGAVLLGLDAAEASRRGTPRRSSADGSRPGTPRRSSADGSRAGTPRRSSADGSRAGTPRRSSADGSDAGMPRRSPADGEPGAAASALVTGVALGFLCLLTTGIYPVNYGGLTAVNDGTDRAVLLLIARNLGLVAFGCWVVARAWVIIARARRYSGRTFAHVNEEPAHVDTDRIRRRDQP